MQGPLYSEYAGAAIANRRKIAPQAKRSCASSSASISASTSASVLYMPNEARQVAVTPR
ncbi:hypothetical protein MALG_01476 [Marinovum algicola DG 898]|nr:hypothetical protein MALG_01476 [Marinovum algicola DG 898]